MEYKITKKLTKKRIDEILKIKKTQGLTAENIIKSARNPKNPLHNLFEWDNKIASEKYRIHQALLLINQIRIKIKNKTYIAFENVKVKVNNSNSKNSFERRYMEMNEIISNKQLRLQILNRAVNQLTFWQTQYNNYKELKPVYIAIEKVKNKIKGAKK